LRGGFGIFFDSAGRLAATVLGGTISSAQFLSGVTFPLTVSQATLPAPSQPTAPYAAPLFESGLKQPRTYEWNASIEQSIGTNQTVTASYVGAAGRNLLRIERLLNPTPEFATIAAITNLATSDYESMQLQFKRRLSRGFQGLASYTWSHSIDEASRNNNGIVVQDSSNIFTSRGDSDFDARHRFVANAIYDLPFTGNRVVSGWSVAPIVSFQSGNPFNIIVNNTAVTGSGGLRPNLTGTPIITGNPLSPTGWFANPSVGARSAIAHPNPIGVVDYPELA